MAKGYSFDGLVKYTDTKVAKSGDTMTGALKISVDGAGVIVDSPTAEGAAYLKGRLNGVDSWWVGNGSASGDDIQLYNYVFATSVTLKDGHILLSHDPRTNAAQGTSGSSLTRKDYVDNGFLKITGGTLTGALKINAAASHLEFQETDYTATKWRIEMNQESLDFTENSVATQVKFKKGGDVWLNNNLKADGNITAGSELQGSLHHTDGYFIFKNFSSSYGTGHLKGYFRDHDNGAEMGTGYTGLFFDHYDEAGVGTDRPIDINLGGNYVYHYGRKPTAADVKAVAKTGDTMTGNLYVQAALQVGPGADGAFGGDVAGSLTSKIGIIAPADTNHAQKTGIVFHHRSSSTSTLSCNQLGASEVAFNFTSDDTAVSLQVEGKRVYNDDFKQLHTIGTPTELGPNVDLDTLKLPGVYSQSLNSEASTALHYPEANAGALVIHQGAGCTQVYYVYNSSRIWSRSQFNTGAWTAWAKEYNTLNKPTPADIGAVDINGSTMDGPLKFKVAGSADTGIPKIEAWADDPNSDTGVNLHVHAGSAVAVTAGEGAETIAGGMLKNYSTEYVVLASDSHTIVRAGCNDGVASKEFKFGSDGHFTTPSKLNNTGLSTANKQIISPSGTTLYLSNPDVVRLELETIGGEVYAKVDGGTSHRVYHQGFKPTAADVGAVPASGGTAEYSRQIIPKQASWGEQTDTFRHGAANAPHGSGRSDFVDWIQWGHNGGQKLRHTLWCPADGSKLSELWFANQVNTTDTDGPATHWRIYHQGFKPTAADVSALPTGTFNYVAHKSLRVVYTNTTGYVLHFTINLTSLSYNTNSLVDGGIRLTGGTVPVILSIKNDGSGEYDDYQKVAGGAMVSAGSTFEFYAHEAIGGIATIYSNTSMKADRYYIDPDTFESTGIIRAFEDDEQRDTYAPDHIMEVGALPENWSHERYLLRPGLVWEERPEYIARANLGNATGMQQEGMNKAIKMVTHFDMLDEPEAKAQWKSYYRELRNLDKLPEWPLVNWPTEPEV